MLDFMAWVVILSEWFVWLGIVYMLMREHMVCVGRPCLATHISKYILKKHASGRQVKFLLRFSGLQVTPSFWLFKLRLPGLTLRHTKRVLARQRRPRKSYHGIGHVLWILSKTLEGAMIVGASSP